MNAEDFGFKWNNQYKHQGSIGIQEEINSRGLNTMPFSTSSKHRKEKSRGTTKHLFLFANKDELSI